MTKKPSYKALYEESKQFTVELEERLVELRLLAMLFLYKLGSNVEINSNEIQAFFDTTAPLLFYELDNSVTPRIVKYRLPNAEETQKFREEEEKESINVQKNSRL